MAENKQLTVAELLARAREENPEGGAADVPKKRRRRRSLEDGGISVAELTGSFRAVSATPTQSRHSSVPIDAAPVATEPAAAEPVTQPEAPAKPSAAATLADKVQPKQEAPAKSGAVEKPEVSQKSDGATGQNTPAQQGLGGEQPKAPSDDDTNIIGAVPDDLPAVSDTTAIDTTAADSEVTDSETGEIPLVDTPDLPAGRDVPRAGGAFDPVAADSSTAVVALSQSHDSYDAWDSDGEGDEDDESSMNMGAVILLAILGIVIGVGIFLGFQYLWVQLPLWIVAVAAVVVTGVMVGVVKWLRTNSDAVSMSLAAVVGLVITFGPAALVLL